MSTASHQHAAMPVPRTTANSVVTTPAPLEVRFAAEGGTVVEIEHRGWDTFGEAGSDRRDRADPATDTGKPTALGPADDGGLDTLAVKGARLATVTPAKARRCC